MDTTNIDYPKRQLLKYSAYTLILGTLGWLSPVTLSQARISTKYPLDRTMPLDSMQVLGREYLRKFPEENSRRTLLTLLESDSGPQGDGRHELSWHRLRVSIKNDFAVDDVVFLQNWSLARTEARLCALSVV